MTPTQLLLQGAYATPQVTTPTGSVVTLSPPSTPGYSEQPCFLCGGTGAVFPHQSDEWKRILAEFPDIQTYV